MKIHGMAQIEFHDALLKALGYADRRVRKIVLTCEVGQADIAEITEVIVEDDTLKELTNVITLVRAE